MAKKYSEDIQRLLKTVYDDCVQEDQSVRERQIRQWRKLKLLWEGFNQVWYSEVAHDWRIWGQDEEADDNDQAYYDKPVNVFKAYLESIIAALSVTVPPVKCYPDDATNTLDISTAKAGDKIAQLVYRHNNAPIIWLHSLFVFVTEGMTAFKVSKKFDKRYGTYEKEYFEDVEEETESLVCTNCGFPIEPGQSGELINQEIDEFGPGQEDVEIRGLLAQGQEICPECLVLGDPELKKDKFVTTRLVGTTTEPKGRICIESFGGLYVKIPNYCKSQASLPYLIYSNEFDYSTVIERFQHLHGNKELVKKIKSGQNPGGYEWYAQWGRLSPQYRGEYPQNVVTVNEAYIRPAKFNMLPDMEDVKRLKKLFPDGVKVTFVDDQFAEACNESLDDTWTLTENPLSDYLHFEPLGSTLVSVQDITNDLISLVLQTIEHGIGQTFADPAVLQFNAYQQTSVLPGGVFPATPKSGKTLGDAFHELKTATLSGEVMPFAGSIQSMGQTVSGALPSIFGGEQAGAGGDTASGYSQSKAGALQRLQNTWKLFTITWKETMGKVVPLYITLVNEDERDVQLTDDGNFVNTFIKKAELEGKIGKVELEANENLPMTWSQRKDLMMTLLQATNPKIMELLNAPENASLIHDALGLTDFYVPNEDSVIKQYDELKILLNSEPMPTGGVDPMTGQPMEVPSVEIDPDFDVHPVEFEIVRKWACSEAGQQAKMENPAGYKNALLHGRMHLQMIQQQMAMQQQVAEANPQGDDAKKPGDNTPNEKRDKTKGPVVEAENVPA